MLAVGAALGGLVASVFGRDVAFAANAVSFVAAAVFVSLIRAADAGAAAGNRRTSLSAAPHCRHARGVHLRPARLTRCSPCWPRRRRSRWAPASWACWPCWPRTSCTAATARPVCCSGARGLGVGSGSTHRRSTGRPITSLVLLKLCGCRRSVVRRVLPGSQRGTCAGHRGAADVAGSPGWRRAVDAVDLRPATSSPGSHPRPHPGGRLRHRHADHHRLEPGRRWAGVGGRACGSRSPRSRCWGWWPAAST